MFPVLVSTVPSVAKLALAGSKPPPFAAFPSLRFSKIVVAAKVMTYSPKPINSVPKHLAAQLEQSRTQAHSRHASLQDWSESSLWRLHVSCSA